MNPAPRTPLTHPCLAGNGSGIHYPAAGPVDAVGEPCAACLGDGIKIDRRTLRHDDGPEPCWYCNSKKPAYFSRIFPMGYHCPDCGKTDNPTFVQVELGTLLYARESVRELIRWLEATSEHSHVTIRETAEAAMDRARKLLTELPNP